MKDKTKTKERLKNKILLALKEAGGTVTRTHLFKHTLQRNVPGKQIELIMGSVLAGLVELKNGNWTLTTLGWAEVNASALASPQNESETPQEAPASEAFVQFKKIARENPDASPERLLQLAGRGLGDPLTNTPKWNEFRAKRPEWYLDSPASWYPQDVELNGDYPARYPIKPECATSRATSDAAWFKFAMSQPGASLEPFAVTMPAFEVANILRVSRKVGKPAALEIFGEDRIRTALELAGVRKTG
jgi:hypothetical protein